MKSLFGLFLSFFALTVGVVLAQDQNRTLKKQTTTIIQMDVESENEFLQEVRVEEFDEKGNKIAHNDWKYINKYDDQGRLIEVRKTNADGSLAQKNATKYGEGKSKTVTAEEYKGPAGQEKITAVNIAKYNADGKIAEETRDEKETGNQGHRIYTYGDKGYTLNQAYAGKVFTFHYKTDEKGRATEETAKDGGGKLYSRQVYVRNEQGDITEYKWYNQEDKLAFRQVYKLKYEKGRIVEVRGLVYEGESDKASSAFRQEQSYEYHN